MNDHRIRQAVTNYQAALVNLEEERASLADSKTSRNSVLFCFILVFEAFWKLLKVLLLQEGAIEVASPKDALRQAYQIGWLTAPDTPWLTMAIDRNLIAHIYSEAQAIEIFERVQAQYTFLLRQLADKLSRQFPQWFEEV